jgi:hypothetical protein
MMVMVVVVVGGALSKTDKYFEEIAYRLDS